MKKSKFLIIGLIIFALSACNKNDTTTAFVVRLTDSPGDYEAVNIDVQSVQVHVSEGNQEDGWVTLASNPAMYNLLDFTNGVETVIANDQYPTGKISQLRLVLGDNNTVQVDGVEFPLTVPSGSESGLKVLINADLVEGITYSVLLDFDAAKSVVSAGNSQQYLLKPVIKAITEAQDGAVKGTVIPADLGVAVYAIQGEDTISTSYAIEGNADFFLGGLANGDYSISFDPGELSGYQPITTDNVPVVLGEVDDLGETELLQ